MCNLGCSTVSDLVDRKKMMNAQEMEGPLAATRDLGTSIRDVMKTLETFAWLVESQVYKKTLSLLTYTCIHVSFEMY